MIFCSEVEMGNSDGQTNSLRFAALLQMRRPASNSGGQRRVGRRGARRAARVPLEPVARRLLFGDRAEVDSATVAIGLATKDVKEGRTLPVPKHHGEGAWVDQEYVPSDATYYTPSDWGFEAVIRERMAEIERRRAEGRMESGEALSEPDA